MKSTLLLFWIILVASPSGGNGSGDTENNGIQFRQIKLVQSRIGFVRAFFQLSDETGFVDR
jgi:hypothetical protein